MGATAAPQDNSDITYVQIQPITDRELTNPVPHPRVQVRESRIENIPLTIRSYVDERLVKEPVYLNFTHHKEPDSVVEVKTENGGDNKNIDHRVKSRSYDLEDFTPNDDELVELTTTESLEGNAETTEKPYFVSKLSYFLKNDDNVNRINNVIVEGYRKFRSRCRCERIWNCPKLQITVPRCPEDYFMCCF